MQLTISLPDEIGRRLERLPDPDRFITDALKRALEKRPTEEPPSSPQPSRWARLAQHISEDPVHLQGYSRQLEQDVRRFREGFAFRHDER